MKPKHFLITEIKEFELEETSKGNVIQFDFPEVRMEAERVSVSGTSEYPLLRWKKQLLIENMIKA